MPSLKAPFLMAAISSIQSVPRASFPEVHSISAYKPCSFGFTAGNVSLQRFRTDFHCKMKFLCLLFVFFSSNMSKG